MKPRFEEHEGQLFRILEEPVPLTPDAEMPCLVRYIQDSSPMGRYMKRKYAEVINTVAIVSRIGTDGRAYSSDKIFIEEVEVFEIIGYPVEEGSHWWALYQMMQGEKVTKRHLKSHVYWHYDASPHLKCISEYNCGTLQIMVSPEIWIKTADREGWQIYKEPEQPKYKVGDWVDCKDHAGVHAQCKVLEIHKHNVILGCKTGHRWSLPHNNIIRKLSHSEVIVRIGCLSGTVRRINDIFFCLNPSTEKGWVVPEARIPHAMLDTNTRSLVESLLEAQEEENDG